MKSVMLFFLLLSVPLPPPENVRVHDGDTIYVDFPRVPDVLGKNLGVRLLGIDTPELLDPDPVVRSWAEAARDYLTKRVASCKKVELKKASVSRDKFYRLDAVVLLDGVDIQQELIAKGYAKPYDGAKKNPWTRADVPVTAIPRRLPERYPAKSPRRRFSAIPLLLSR